METTENTIEVALPVADAHRTWFEFIGEPASGGTAAGKSMQADVPTDRVVSEGPSADNGTIMFDAVDDNNRTRVTMQLRYNPQALADAGLDRDWVSQRIGLYLERYKKASSDRPGA